MSDIDLSFGQLKQGLDAKLKFCEQLHKKHHKEVGDYQRFADNFDPSKFNIKLQKLTF